DPKPDLVRRRDRGQCHLGPAGPSSGSRRNRRTRSRAPHWRNGRAMVSSHRLLQSGFVGSPADPRRSRGRGGPAAWLLSSRQGGALVLWAETDAGLLGADSLAERGKPSERVGEEAAASLKAELESQATLDLHDADQLLIYLARADGPSEFRVRAVSGHMETMMWLIPQFVPCRFAVAREAGGWKVSVEPGD